MGSRRLCKRPRDESAATRPDFSLLVASLRDFPLPRQLHPPSEPSAHPTFFRFQHPGSGRELQDHHLHRRLRKPSTVVEALPRAVRPRSVLSCRYPARYLRSEEDDADPRDDAGGSGVGGAGSPDVRGVGKAGDGQVCCTGTSSQASLFNKLELNGFFFALLRSTRNTKPRTLPRTRWTSMTSF